MVVGASYNDSNGNYVRINNTDGTQTVYLHLLASSVTAGTVITAGQQIGTMNCTGSCTGSAGDNTASGTHVHVQVYRAPGSPNTLAGTLDPMAQYGGASCTANP